MPTYRSYPGVYIQETSIGGRVIPGVATAVAAFVGRALRGLVNQPTRILSFSDFEKSFGGLSRDSSMSYAVQQFFDNGGNEALIVRVHNNSKIASLTLANKLTFVAANCGKWGNAIRIRIDHKTTKPKDTALFNITVFDTIAGTSEIFEDVSTDKTSSRFVTHILKQQSNLIRVRGEVPRIRPHKHNSPAKGKNSIADDSFSTQFGDNGSDGKNITDNQLSKSTLKSKRQGIWALEKAASFNLLCIPPLTLANNGNIGAQTRRAAATYCEQRQAIFLTDPLMSWNAVTSPIGEGGITSPVWGVPHSDNIAFYFPHINCPDPLRNNQLSAFAPCGAVAGVIARTDFQRGVWKSPAGTEARLRGVSELSIRIGDDANNQLNNHNINCLRALPRIGPVIWGARVLSDTNQSRSDSKYLAVRRLSLFIQDSVMHGTDWVVFEPNDEPLWAEIHLAVGRFMQQLFRNGSFVGDTQDHAYFVTCGRDTMSQYDIDRGIIRLVIGFAPIKPAEFVVLNLSIKAGKT